MSHIRVTLWLVLRHLSRVPRGLLTLITEIKKVYDLPNGAWSSSKIKYRVMRKLSPIETASAEEGVNNAIFALG